MRKILPYLLLNFAVSALAVWIVLMVWEANHQIPNIPAADQTVTRETKSPTITPPPLDEKTITIQLVMGRGDIRSERVQLVSASPSPVNLQGWELVDEDKNRYQFPSVTLFPGAAIELYTKGGVNTAGELFWNREEPVYISGEKILLKDTSGNIRSEYQVP